MPLEPLCDLQEIKGFIRYTVNTLQSTQLTENQPTSSTKGKTAGMGNRATVFFITISLRVWKTFCRKEKGGERKAS